MAFEPRDYIGIFGICVAASVALSIGHMHRKQMRQIEAYKADPKAVDLIPPPLPVWRFVRRYWYVGFAAYAVWSLVDLIGSDRPLSRYAVGSIAINVCSIFFYGVCFMVQRLSDFLFLLNDNQQAMAQNANLEMQILRLTNEKAWLEAKKPL